METLDTNLQLNNSIVIDDEVKSNLLESSKWAKFISIMGFISMGLLGLLVLLSFIFPFVRVPNQGYANSNAQIVSLFATALMTTVIIALEIFPLYFLLKYSKGISQGIKSNNNLLLVSGFRYLKSHYKFMGILMIILISIMSLMFLLPLVAILIKLF